jgi:LuxR family maltose regulon positive regulatory protein
VAHPPADAALKATTDFATFAAPPLPIATLPSAKVLADLPADATWREALTKREREILDLIALGLTNGEIGQQISISNQTVKVHTRNLYGKLGVNGRREAVAKARVLGLLAGGAGK